MSGATILFPAFIQAGIIFRKVVFITAKHHYTRFTKFRSAFKLKQATVIQIMNGKLIDLNKPGFKFEIWWMHPAKDNSSDSEIKLYQGNVIMGKIRYKNEN